MSEQYWVVIYGACVVFLLNPVYSFVCFRKSTPQARDIFAFYILDAFAQVCRLFPTRVAYDTESDTSRTQFTPSPTLSGGPTLHLADNDKGCKA